MSVDAGRFEGNTHFLPMIWSLPLQVSLSLYFLWTLLGPSVLAGLAVMILLIPINGTMAKKVRSLHVSAYILYFTMLAAVYGYALQPNQHLLAFE